jgi:hypothetical protein
VLHVHGDTQINGVILQRANQFEPRAVADVREPRVPVPAEIALIDAPVGRAIEYRAPRFELANAIRSFLRVQFGHAPVVHVLAAAHRVGEVHFPVVAVVVVAERRGHAAFGHDRVGLAEEGLADESDRHARGRSLDGGPEPGPARTDHEDVVAVDVRDAHQKILRSLMTPIEHSRT